LSKHAQLPSAAFPRERRKARGNEHMAIFSIQILKEWENDNEAIFRYYPDTAYDPGLGRIRLLKTTGEIAIIDLAPMDQEVDEGFKAVFGQTPFATRAMRWVVRQWEETGTCPDRGDYIG
jgi:hypothetical protein